MKQKGIQVVDSYNDLVKKLKTAGDTIANLQREKDFKITRISKEYEAKIDIAMREEDALKSLISHVHDYLAKH